MSQYVVTFGEIMGRLAAPGHWRLRQTRVFEATYAGAEASVAASICHYGGRARFVTALPKHALAEAAVDSLRAVGIDTRYIVRTDRGRLGLYFLEIGANQRPSLVVYDRDQSAVALTPAEEYDWPAILADARWLHLTGITPALSRNAAEATRMAAQKAREAGCRVSLDLNFRSKLWRWDPAKKPRELAGETMRGILPFVDVVVANEADCEDVLGIRAGGSDVEAGRLETDRYPEVARQVVAQFPNVRQVAITLRESISASHNNWGGMLYDAGSDRAFFAPRDGEGRYRPYEIRDIVDRVGAGDAFAGGLIFALTTPELAEPQTALNFAVAASCLKHSIHGDFNWASRSEVEALMRGAASGRVVR
ncbi:MAG: sugar kinase [Verrucomicrobia bacterium]|nr:MAG: sugar kinase [Verrucomicrobiota bacterium]